MGDEMDKLDKTRTLAIISFVLIVISFIMAIFYWLSPLYFDFDSVPEIDWFYFFIFTCYLGIGLLFALIGFIGGFYARINLELHIIGNILNIFGLFIGGTLSLFYLWIFFSDILF
jgi:hypothetical protein